MANLVHAEISEILDGQLHPEPLYWTRYGRDRPATRGVTTSSLALADALEGEELTPGGEGGKCGEGPDEISSVTVPPTDELILADGAKLERWDAYNKQLFSVLFLSIKGAADSFAIGLRVRKGQKKEGVEVSQAPALLHRRCAAITAITGHTSRRLRCTQDPNERIVSRGIAPSLADFSSFREMMQGGCLMIHLTL